MINDLKFLEELVIFNTRYYPTFMWNLQVESLMTMRLKIGETIGSFVRCSNAQQIANKKINKQRIKIEKAFLQFAVQISKISKKPNSHIQMLIPLKVVQNNLFQNTKICIPKTVSYT